MKYIWPLIIFICSSLISFFLVSQTLKNLSPYYTLTALVFFCGFLGMVFLLWFIFKQIINVKSFFVFSILPVFLIFLLGYLENPKGILFFLPLEFGISISGFLAGFAVLRKKYLYAIGLFIFTFLTISLYHFKLLPDRYFEKNISRTAPAFEQLDSVILYKTDGSRIEEDFIHNKVLVINFWFIGCKPCEIKKPFFEELSSRFRSNPDVFFINIHYKTRATLEQIQAFQSLNPTSLEYFYDLNGDLAKMLNVDRMPVEYVIDKDLRIVSIYQGFDYYDKDLYLRNRRELITSLLKSNQ